MAKRRLSREDFRALQKRKAEIRARPPAIVPPEFRGVTVEEPEPPKMDGLSLAMAMMATMMLRRHRGTPWLRP